MNARVRRQANPILKPSFAPIRSNLVQRKCAWGGTPGVDGECAECRNTHLQRQGSNYAKTETPTGRETLNSPGQPLDEGTRAFMEPRFGFDFSQVRVHADAQAAESARALNAKAFTVGRDVIFGAAQYAPSTSAGRRLLAHEIAHVVQQDMGHTADGIHAGTQAEQEARVSADQLVGGAKHVRIRHGIAAPAIQAQSDIASNPLTLPKEGIEMPWVGKGRPSSELGYLRDPQYFWAQWVQRWGERSSPENKARITAGTAPIVDDHWIKFYPEHAQYKGQPLEHHHIGQGSRAVPLPEKLHDAYTVFHPQRQEVGKGSKPLKPIKPQPTSARTEKEMARHIKEGRIQGPGIDSENPPKASAIPPSSELAALPPEQLRPVAQKGLEEVQRVDPTTGKVTNKVGPTASSAPENVAATPPETTTTTAPPKLGQAKPPTTAPAEPPAATITPKLPTPVEELPSAAPTLKPPAVPSPTAATVPVVEGMPSPVVAPPVRPTFAWKAGLKAGGKALLTVLIFAGLEYLVHRQLAKDLDESIDKARHGAMPWAQRLKRKDPSKPVYMSVKVQSEEYSNYFPFLGWMPESPVLHMIAMEMVREQIDPPLVEVQDNRTRLLRPGVTTTVTYTELLVP